MSAHMLEASLLGVGTVLRLESDAWSMVKLPRRATNEYPPPAAHYGTRLHFYREKTPAISSLVDSNRLAP